MKSNVAKKFLKLLDKHFPPDNKLHKIFNRNTVKVSYSCTGNIEQVIKTHNNKILSPRNEETANCNCRKECPIEGKCRSSNSIYKCTVSANNKPNKVYIGLAGGEWKTRYRNHVKSFNHKRYAKETCLSKYIWELKDEGIDNPILNWTIVKSAPTYTNISKRCLLCLQEKLEIITYTDPNELLNKKDETISKCRHENEFLLLNYKSKD